MNTIVMVLILAAALHNQLRHADPEHDSRSANAYSSTLQSLGAMGL